MRNRPARKMLLNASIWMTDQLEKMDDIVNMKTEITIADGMGRTRDYWVSFILPKVEAEEAKAKLVQTKPIDNE